MAATTGIGPHGAATTGCCVSDPRLDPPLEEGVRQCRAGGRGRRIIACDQEEFKQASPSRIPVIACCDTNALDKAPECRWPVASESIKICSCALDPHIANSIWLGGNLPQGSLVLALGSTV